ncbi:hypothetical protein B0I08_109128 [Glaciihabitans tibetensis]|uniref:Uncharacterized protein n=1 Tax=Glaciihabitans tibetensis TaxID=1266600 RepID=A0A2T0V7E7_9MICO|nr:hypothetical protein B0I08_109128 [Glaciihabitans tibetensis]
MAAGLALALATGPVLGGQQLVRAEYSSAVATAEYSAAVNALGQRVAAATSIVQSIAATKAAAQSTLDGSTDRVLGEGPRAWLRAALASADSLLSDLRAEVARTEQQPASSTLSVRAIREQTMVLDRLVRPDPARVAAVRRALVSSTSEVATAVSAWQVEQDRIAAEAAAAQAAAEAAAAALAQQIAAEVAAAAAAEELAAKEAAARAARAAGNQTAAPDSGAPASASAAEASAPAPAPAVPAAYSEYVWTTGFQVELDACRGSVNMTPSFGIPVIGEHWSCGGKSFPKSEGALVQLSGALSGTYVVGPIVAILNKHTNRIGDVPHGSDLLYQTCINGDNTRMSFTQLTRVG